MPYRVQVVDGRVETPGVPPTWLPRLEIPFESGSWGRKRNSGASGQVVVNTLAEAFASVQRLPVWPWQSWVVIEWRHPFSETWKIIYAGVIQEAAYKWSSKKLTLSHTDIWAILGKRIITNDRTYQIAESKVVWTGLSAGTMIKRVFQNITDSKGSPLVYELPIVFPADVVGTKALTVYGYNFMKADALIQELIGDEDGPDIDFLPRWSTSGTLEWVLEINANKTKVWDYDLDADVPSVIDLDYRLNGDDLCVKMYGAGEGTERRTLVRQSDHNDTNYLAMEDQIKFSSVSNTDRLQSLTTGARFLRDGAIRQVDMVVRADGSPSLTDLALGGYVRWKADKDKWLVSGWHEWELIEYSGSLTNENINLVTQEMEGRAADL